ncbi:MAG: FtsX-like permease family protein [Oscillospiraceae bacterium]
MIKKSLRKNIQREIRSSASRFAAIFAITALGAGFFSGLKATGPGMRTTADTYYTAQHLMDYRLLSPLGFTDADVSALRALPDVQNVMATQGLDVLVDMPDAEAAVRLLALPADTAETNPDYLNRPVVTEGRLPTAPNECLVDSATSYALGDTLKISNKNTEQSLELLSTTEFTVVGRASSPSYISFQRGNTTIGDGSLSFFLYVPQSSFTGEVYTEIFLTAWGAEGLSSFSAAYESLIDSGTASLETLGKTQSTLRYTQLYSEGSETLATARQELADARAEADEKLAEALQKIEDGERDIESARAEIAENAAKLEEARAALASGDAALASGKNQLAQKQAEYDEGLAAYNSQLAQYQAALAGYNQQKAEYDATEALLNQAETGLSGFDTAAAALTALAPAAAAGDETAKATFAQTAAAATAGMREMATSLAAAGMAPEAAALQSGATAIEQALAAQDYTLAASALGGVSAGVSPALAAARQQLEASLPALVQAAEGLAQWKAGLDASAQQLAGGKTQLEAAAAQIASGEGQLASARQQIAEGETQLASARRQVASAQQTLADGKEEYNTQKAEAEQKIADAETEIADGQQQLNDLAQPEWFVFTRTSNPGYSGFPSDSDRIDALAAVIPVFFYFVAALVCLTTMTRMVEEQRTLIGTFKALGFGKGAIAFKYIFYAAFASLAGGIFGVAAGTALFPAAIWNAYRIMYRMPPLATAPDWGLVALSILTVVGCTALATLAACYSELKSVPAQLMRPKAPKAGTRVLLERIPFVWKHMGFSQKVTARNLFRYKKRFFMTIVGVAGCTALLLTGFGLRDAITGIVPLQFGQIDQYDMVAALSEPSSAAEDTPLNQLLPGLGQSMYTQSIQIDAQTSQGNSNGMTTHLFIAEDPAALNQFISFHTRSAQQPIAFPQGDGVIVTEKLATRLGAEVGSTISINRANEKPVSVTVAGIMENYVRNYVYITPSAYQSLFGEAPEYDTLLLKLPEEAALSRSDTLAALVGTSGVAGASDLNSFRSEVNDMLKSLNSVVWLVIASAATLAFVVLYNLTNINITERAREIATLKVLGFYNNEVASYVYRENILLTGIGSLAGLLGGIFLHRFVISTVEIDEVMFRRGIEPLSFVWALLFTLLSTVLVNLVMLPRLRSIDMVESLKSAE